MKTDPPLNDLVLAAVALTEPDAGPERNAVIAGVLPEVARCTCVLCQRAERELSRRPSVVSQPTKEAA